jgi:MORN repeat
LLERLLRGVAASGFPVNRAALAATLVCGLSSSLAASQSVGGNGAQAQALGLSLAAAESVSLASSNEWDAHALRQQAQGDDARATSQVAVSPIIANGETITLNLAHLHAASANADWRLGPQSDAPHGRMASPGDASMQQTSLRAAAAHVARSASASETHQPLPGVGDQRRSTPRDLNVPAAASSLSAASVGPSSGDSTRAPELLADRAASDEGGESLRLAAVALPSSAATAVDDAPGGSRGPTAALAGRVGEFAEAVVRWQGGLVATRLTSGGFYTGEWRNDQPNGRGALIYANGVRYRGEFANGAPTGAGVFLDANGRVLRGAQLFAALLQGEDAR